MTFQDKVNAPFTPESCHRFGIPRRLTALEIGCLSCRCLVWLYYVICHQMRNIEDTWDGYLSLKKRLVDGYMRRLSPNVMVVW